MREVRERVLTDEETAAHRGPPGGPRQRTPSAAADEVLATDGAVKVLIKIDHLGIAVPTWTPRSRPTQALGFAVESTHEVPTEKVRAAFLPVGESRLELLEPTDPSSVDRALPGEAVRAAPRLRAGGGHRGGAGRR